MMSFREVEPTLELRRFFHHFECDYLSTKGIPEYVINGYSIFKMEPPKLDSLFSAVEKRMTSNDVKEASKKYKLNDRELMAVLIYTADWSLFGIPFEQTLPYWLNTPEHFETAREQAWEPYLFHLLNGLEKLPNHTGWAYKGLKSVLTLPEKHTPEVTLFPFLSLTTFEPKLNESIKTLMAIKISENGRLLGAISMNPLEGELLLLPTSWFETKITNLGPPEQWTFTEQSHMSLLYSNPFIAAMEGNTQKLSTWHMSHDTRHSQPSPSLFSSIVDREHNNASLLYTAARFGQASVVKYLLNYKVKVNAVQAQGSSALHAAAYYGHFEVVKLLVEGGIDVNIRNRWDSTALAEATSMLQKGQQWKDIVNYLQDHSNQLK